MIPRVLTKFGKCLQYTIFDVKQDGSTAARQLSCYGEKWRKSSRLCKDEITELLTKMNATDERIAQNILLGGCHCVYFLRSICKE